MDEDFNEINTLFLNILKDEIFLNKVYQDLKILD
jgi:hypothetical protein